MKYDRAKVLLTDSDIHVLHKLKHVLTDNGYEVFRANTTAKLLLLLKFYHFDLILFDVTIPNINVLDIIDQIQSVNSNTAIVISNDAANYDLAIESVKRGAYDLLVKPYDAASLLNLIQDALNYSAQMMRDKSASHNIEPADNVYQFMVENSQDIQYILDYDKKFTYINKRVETLLGYRRSELIGKHYSEIIFNDDLDKARSCLHDEDCTSPLSQNIELRLKYKKNKDVSRYFDITTIPLPQTTHKNNFSSNTEHNGIFNRAATYAIAHDVTYRKKIEQIAQEKANYDHLTSLPNNILFHDRVNLAIANAKRDNTIFAIMYLDLDEFKEINDSYGHHNGDKVLREMSTRMQSCLRASDTLARVGGDEFTLLLPQIKDINEAAVIANKLMQSVIAPFYINKKKHVLSASIGIAFYPDDGQTRESLIQAADKAMYHIKNGHKNGYQYSTN